MKQFMRALFLVTLIRFPVLEGIDKLLIFLLLALGPHFVIQYLVGTHHAYLCIPWALLFAFIYAKIIKM